MVKTCSNCHSCIKPCGREEIDPEQVMTDMVSVHRMAIELFKGDLDKADKWLISNNLYLSGNTPKEMCLLGKGYMVVNMLKERL